MIVTGKVRYIPLFLLFFILQAATGQVCLPSISGENVISECDYCQCSQGISPMETGSTGIRLDVRSLYRGAFYNGSEKQATSNGVYETYLTNQLIVNYRFAESPFTLSATIPYVIREAYDPKADPVVAKGEGIADISAVLRYNHKKYIDESLVGYSIIAGIKFAAGSTSSINSRGDTLDPHIRPGSGTTDIIIGGAGIWSLNRIGVSATCNLGLVTGSGAPTADGKHKFGNYLLGEITGRYRIIPADVNESNLSLTLGLGGETHAKETVNGLPVTASGETIVYLTPGLKYILSMKISVDASVEIPLYQYEGWDPATGEHQLGQSYRLIAGFQYLL